MFFFGCSMMQPCRAVILYSWFGSHKWYVFIIWGWLYMFVHIQVSIVVIQIGWFVIDSWQDNLELEQLGITPCAHYFCLPCLTQQVERTQRCGVCRHPLKCLGLWLDCEGCCPIPVICYPRHHHTYCIWLQGYVSTYVCFFWGERNLRKAIGFKGSVRDA